jgi:hypothetical protein
MAGATFHHFGVPTKKQGEKEHYIEGAKVYTTNPEEHPYRVEFLRFEEGSPLPEAVQKNCHIAFLVDDLEKALEGQNVIVEPFDPRDTLRVAFIMHGDAVIELMQST